MGKNEFYLACVKEARCDFKLISRFGNSVWTIWCPNIICIAFCLKNQKTYASWERRECCSTHHIPCVQEATNRVKISQISTYICMRPHKVMALYLYPQDTNKWLETRFNVCYLSVVIKGSWVTRSDGTYLEKWVGFGGESCEKRKIIHRISLISIHRCTSYDIWAIIVNIKYDDRRNQNEIS